VDEFWWDDLYVCSNAGTLNNTNLGDVRISTLLPTGAGNYAQWARGGTDSGSNWGQVDEATYNSDTDYVQSNTIGQIDTYVYADLPASAQVVKGVVAQYVAKRDDAGARTTQAVVRAASTDAFSPGSTSAASGYQPAQLVMERNPVTGLPWTVSDVNGAEFGYRVTA
jgi:hypothetical protein